MVDVQRHFPFLLFDWWTGIYSYIVNFRHAKSCYALAMTMFMCILLSSVKDPDGPS
jgi:hypothetical protein